MATETLLHNKLTWTNIEKPTSQEMGDLRECYHSSSPF